MPLDDLMRSVGNELIIVETVHGALQLRSARAIYVGQNESRPSLDYLKFLANTFRHCVWLNPVDRDSWFYTWTVKQIAGVFPMFELSLDGLEKAVHHLMTRN